MASTSKKFSKEFKSRVVGIPIQKKQIFDFVCKKKALLRNQQGFLIHVSIGQYYFLLSKIVFIWAKQSSR
ncbi:MAG: hypothetical protein H6Q14_3006 [Bacteroidetes bacterium]|jgi:hypothetical protein|nr:hypothetical protein [Bacteroidota bacterium]